MIEKICDICGNGFSVRNYRKNTAKYCSNDCRYESYRGQKVPVKKRFWEKVNKIDDCWEWVGCKQSQGYGQIRIKGKAILAHRIVLELTTGEVVPDDLFVCHKCDNPACVNPDHLFVGTAADNTADMFEKGRENNPSGQNASRAKLTNEQVRIIRKDKRTIAELAREYNISHAAMSKVVKGITYVGIF